jgi:uncharacterized membrane protein HdeD (DUF308 family)/alpha-beta hydrolase superfamily lysophospholipase
MRIDSSALLTRQTRRLGQVPWAWRSMLGLSCLLLGGAVLTRPFDSLTLLVALIAACLLVEGMALLVREDHGGRTVLAGCLLVAVAVLVVAWPAISVGALALVVGASFLVNGAHDLASAVASRNDRTGALISAATWLIFGGLILVWPDVAILVTAVAFGVRLIVFGVGVIVRALRDRRADRGASATRPTARPNHARAVRLAGRSLLLALAVALLAASAYLHTGTTRPTAFYTPPADIPAQPGYLIRSQPYTHGMLEGTRGWLILYTTRGVHDDPRVGSAFVMAPAQHTTTPHPVVLWTHGTEGADVTCAPTLLPEPLPLAGPVAAMRQEIARGRVIVGPDYPGAGTVGRQSYLIGLDEGRSALDAVRAARQLDGLRLAAQTVVWGHSQGGQAAIWTGIIAPTYAPDVELVGIAAAAPASDLPALVNTALDTTFGQVMGTFVMRAYAEAYPDVRVNDYVDPRVQVIYQAMSRRCLPARATLVSVLTAMTLHGSLFSRDPTAGPLGERLADNIPSGPVRAPLFIAQGTADPLVVPTMQDRYVAQRCTAGYPLQYRTYPGRDHLSVVADNSPYIPDLVAWTQDRFDHRPQQNTCR